MTDDTEIKTPPVNDRVKRLLIYAAVLVGVFLLGLVPMWLTSRARASERDKALRELRVCMIQSSLASAAIDARTGDYEPARQGTSSFFTELGKELELDSNSVFDQAQRERLKSLLVPRDELITLLARNDPAAADRLTATFVAFRKAVGSGSVKQ